MRVLGIDPGPVESAFVVYDCKLKRVLWKWDDRNEHVRLAGYQLADRVAIEAIACMGQVIGRDTIETVMWIGRFLERFLDDGTIEEHQIKPVYRREVKMHLCGDNRAKDKNIRGAIISRFEPYGGGSVPEIGTKHAKGPLYGVSSHKWAALGVAITAAETWDQLSDFHDYEPRKKKP